MTGKHRKRRESIAKFTALGAVTATATALTVGIPAQPNQELDAELTQRVIKADVDLTAAINEWPDPDQIPDLTGGLGTLGYDFSQFVAELVIRGIVENFNLSALAQATGLDLESLITGLVGNPDALLGDLLNGVLGQIPIDLTPVLETITGPLTPILLLALDALNLTNADGETTLLDLLGIIGLDLSDPLNLAGLDVPGLNVITAGPAFTLLKLLGVDLGWVPGLPNAVAEEINGTEYLNADAEALVDELLGRLNTALQDATPALAALLTPAISGLQALVGSLPVNVPGVVQIRVPVSVGVGLGAFAVAMSYKKVLADLRNQPGGGEYTLDPVLGSITILPMLLAFNPARPNGGMFARFYPLFRLLGIDTVNPHTEVSTEGEGLLGLEVLGLKLGAANIIPILADIGVEYHPSSDFAAWPNPVTLASNLLAGLLPTYILRGISLDEIDGQLETLITEAFGNLEDGKLALNLYLTLKSDTQPLLEPLYLLSDLTSLATLGLGAINPFGMLANALAPAVEALTNLGYTDVVRNPDGTYTRTLDEAANPTPFLSFPAGINPMQVLPDVFNLLVKGFQKEFFSGNPTPAGPNVISNLLGLLTGGGLNLGPLANLGSLLQGIINNLNLPGLTQPQQQNALMAATDLPDANARSVTLSTTEAALDESADGTDESEPLQDETVDEQPADEEEIVDEQPTEEEVVVDDEEIVDEVEIVDEDAGEEETVDEDEVVDEEADDDEVADEDDAGDEDEASDAGDEDEADDEGQTADKDAESTGPKHAKPDDGKPVSPSLNSPRHAKPDNSPANDANDKDGSSDNDSDSDSGGASADAA